MIRGGHIDVAILGVRFSFVRDAWLTPTYQQAMEVSKAGDIANFMIPGKLLKGIGGAMDLVSNPDRTKVIVVMEHCTKKGKSKILNKCTLPLTGVRAVSTIITDLAVFDVDRESGSMQLIDIADCVTLEEVKTKTEADFTVNDKIGRF